MARMPSSPLERHAPRVGLLGSLSLVAGLYAGGPLGLALGGAGILLLLLAAYSPDHGLLLFGPFALRELHVVTRTPIVFILRVLILSFLLFLFLWVYAQEVRRDALTPNRATEFAEMFFAVVAVITALVTGLYAGWILPTVISEEREAKRLEHLLVTDLRNREILTGKLAGRLVVVLGYAVLVVPVLALLTLLGGVEPRFVLAVGVLYVAGLLGLSGVAIACSAVAGKSAAAVVSAIVVVWLHQTVTYGIGTSKLMPEVQSARLSDAVTAVGMGSVAFTAWQIEDATRANALDTEIPRILRHFVAGQLLVVVAGWLFAVRFLRRDGRRDGGSLVRQAVVLANQPPPRSPVADAPVLWRERTSGSFFIERWAARLLGGQTWVVWVVAFGGSLFHFAMEEVAGNRDSEARVRVAFSSVFCFFATCGPVAWAASRSVVRERQLDTLDALLVTDLEPGEIFRQKWLAAVLSVRYVYGCFVLFWLAAIVTGHVPAVAVLFLVLTSLAALCAAASLGLLASVYSTTAIRAFGKVFFGYVGWVVGVTVMTVCCAAGASGGTRGLLVLAGAILPPAPQVVAGFLGDGSERDANDYLLAVVILGLGVLAAISLVATESARLAFENQTRPTKERKA
jgi:ABC-type transport system involved in multi-copper enzyme maturation permease subunit